MSDGFKTIFAVLRKEVQAGSPRIFLEAQARHPCLALYHDLAAVLAAAGQVEFKNWPKREKLIRALIAECQQTSLPFWGAVLLVLFCPMLNRLRNRLREDILDSDDLDQLVIVGFLKAVATFSSVRHPSFVALGLRQDTQRSVFRALGRERAERNLTDKLRAFVEESDWVELVEEPELSEKESPRSTLVRLVDSYWPQIPLASRLVIFTTVINNEPLRFGYENASGQRSDVCLLPYTLVAFRRGLYVLGPKAEGGNLRLYALERMSEPSQCNGQRFELPKDFDPEAYFKRALWVQPGEPTKVELAFDPKSLRFIGQRRYHHSQTFETMEDGRLRMTLEVPAGDSRDYEIVNFVLGFGPYVEVLAPEGLREKVKAEIGKMRRVYE